MRIVDIDSIETPEDEGLCLSFVKEIVVPVFTDQGAKMEPNEAVYWWSSKGDHRARKIGKLWVSDSIEQMFMTMLTEINEFSQRSGLPKVDKLGRVKPVLVLTKKPQGYVEQWGATTIPMRWATA